MSLEESAPTGTDRILGDQSLAAHILEEFARPASAMDSPCTVRLQPVRATAQTLGAGILQQSQYNNVFLGHDTLQSASALVVVHEVRHKDGAASGPRNYLR
jgi:hypothetical protein